MLSEGVIYFSAKVLEEFGEFNLSLDMYRKILKAEAASPAVAVSCPLLSGPSATIARIKEGTTNAYEEAQAGGDHRQVA